MAEAEFKYDVFISYSHKDEEWAVNTLLPTLEKAGLKVCIDFRDFDAGKPSIVNMENAVDESRHTVVVLTPNWLGSEWTDFEAVLTQTDDPVGRRQKLIPIMLAVCTPPKRIKSFTYVDFMRADRLDNAWMQLFKALGTPQPSNLQPANTWDLKHRYGLAAHFTGRVAERKFLTAWLEHNNEQPLFVLRALGGFGKSALAWYWLLHDVDRTKWKHVVWWSFYDDSNFESFLKETLEYLKVEVPPGPRQQVDLLLKEMEQQNILLVIDGFERALRAFSGMGAAYQGDNDAQAAVPGGGDAAESTDRDLDCVSPAAEDFLRGAASSGGLMQAKVLMTTRLTPRILFVGATGQSPLQGVLEKELLQMEPADAVDFFQKQGIRGTRAEIERACAAYGFHPLSLRLLAGLVIKDKRQPMDIAVAARYKQKVSTDAKQRQHHVLEQSYAGLSPERRALLGKIACFRSSVSYDTLVAITKEDPEIKNLDESLDDLLIRGLIHCSDVPASSPDPLLSTPLISVYDLHPIVRRYSYDKMTAPDRTAAHTRLMDYFAAVPKREKVEKLDDLAPVIELYHHTVRAGKLDQARDLYGNRLDSLYYQFGAYQLIIELMKALFIDGENKPPRLKEENDQAWTLNELANSYSLSGQPRRAVPLFEMQKALREIAGDKENLATGLGNVACMAQIHIGALGEAERNLRHRIDLSREIADERSEATGHRDLGRLLSYRGAWPEAEQELDSALMLFEKQHAIQSEGIVWSYRTLRYLLMAREEGLKGKSLKPAIECAVHALELADETARTRFPHERDYVRAHWLLGAAYRANNDLSQAETHLGESLRRCRAINLVEMEADILLELAKLRHAQGNSAESLRLAQEALVITERSGYVLQGADVNLWLAELAEKGEKLEIEKGLSDKEAALLHAREALKLAHCDDGPPYHYKVAYEEAQRLLEKLK